MWSLKTISPVEEGGEGKDGGAKTCRQFRRFSQKVVDHGSETLEMFNETLGIFVLYGEILAFFYCKTLGIFVLYVETLAFFLLWKCLSCIEGSCSK